MRIYTRLITILSLALTLRWVFTINEYFFKSTLADDVAIVISFGLGIVLSFVVRIKWQHWFVLVIALVLPWLVFPIVNHLVLLTSWGSIALHAFLMLMTAVVILSIKFRNSILIGLSLMGLNVFPFDFQQSQTEYYDRVVSTIETRKGFGTVVQWKGDYWRYYNGILLNTSVDSHVWQEAYVQPALQLVSENAKILVIGGESGLIQRELFISVRKFEVLPFDLEFHYESRPREARFHRFLKGDIDAELVARSNEYDLIIMDLPDPINVDFAQYYKSEFFELVKGALSTNGILVTHSAELFGKSSFNRSILENLAAAGFELTPYHAQVPTIGHWTWVIGSKDSSAVEERLRNIDPVEKTKWWNQEAMDMMLSFGKSEILANR